MGGGRVPAGFTEQRSQVGAVTVNYVRGGSGPTLVLLHGYPQCWYMWRHLLPELGRSFEVIAPDLRGFGDSDAPPGGYDKKTLAGDLHGLLTGLGLDRDLRLVGHDVGTMVAYAYAAAHPARISRLVLSEAPIPDESIYTLPALTAAGPAVWNFGFFNLANGLPEQLVAGREALWVDRFTDSLMVRKGSIGAADIEEYAGHLRDEAHLRASFECFRAFRQDVADNAGYRGTKLAMPVLAVGARASLGDQVAEQVRRYASSVSGEVVEDSGHWLFEEQPAELASLLLRFLRELTRRSAGGLPGVRGQGWVEGGVGEPVGEGGDGVRPDPEHHVQGVPGLVARVEEGVQLVVGDRAPMVEHGQGEPAQRLQPRIGQRRAARGALDQLRRAAVPGERGGVHRDADVALVASGHGQHDDLPLQRVEAARLEDAVRGEEALEQVRGLGHQGDRRGQVTEPLLYARHGRSGGGGRGVGGVGGEDLSGHGCLLLVESSAPERRGTGVTYDRQRG